MGSLTDTGHCLTAHQGFHSQAHNEKHFVRTMRRFKHITQTSEKESWNRERWVWAYLGVRLFIICTFTVYLTLWLRFEFNEPDGHCSVARICFSLELIWACAKIPLRIWQMLSTPVYFVARPGAVHAAVGVERQFTNLDLLLIWNNNHAVFFKLYS